MFDAKVNGIDRLIMVESKIENDDNYWNYAKQLVLDLALEVPEARFVGWDVVLTEKGFDILEGNIPPGEELTELDMKGKYHQVMAMY